MISSNIKVELDCDIKRVWDIVINNKNYSWRSDLSKLEITDEEHFIEYTKNNYPTYFTIISKKQLKEYKLALENSNIKGEWTGLFIKLDNENVLLDFTEEVEINNFIMKLLAKPYLKIQQKRYIKDLKNKIIAGVKNEN